MSGVTNKLIEAAKTAQNGNSSGATTTSKHRALSTKPALASLIKNQNESAQIRKKLDAVIAEGLRFCEGTALLRNSLPHHDAISSSGERSSAPLVSAAVKALGRDSEAVEATELIVTDEFHGGAEPRMEQTRGKSHARILPLLDRGIVPVVTGFLGATPAASSQRWDGEVPIIPPQSWVRRLTRMK